MATAFTSLLGLALPVQGELSGTWGNAVNTQITALLDTSIAGTTTLSTDADVTLTTTTGASNQARQAIILWNATGTVTRNITAPAQSKAYIVINASGGTQSIVLRGAGPTTGITIVQGEKCVAAWNGTDFVKISSAFTGGTTGTGAAVFATSPALITPALGTPTALVGTNITGTAAAFNINGTVGATTPATGSFTALTTSGAVTHNAGTANGVAFLNGSKVLTTGSALTFDGSNVGIGTSSPSRKLDVQGAPSTVGGSGTGVLANFVNNTTAFNASPTAAISLWNRVNSSGGVFPSAVVQAGKENVTDGNYAGYLSLQTTDASGTSTERARLDSSGNLGIGTTSPAAKLDVVGAIKGSTTIGVGAATPSSSGAGITFPATQSASSDANTLDDYEEGTWTPDLTVGFTVVGATTLTGTYTKIGNIVFVRGTLKAATSLTSAGGNTRVTGFPFTTSATTGVTFALDNLNFPGTGFFDGAQGLYNPAYAAGSATVIFTFFYTV